MTGNCTKKNKFKSLFHMENEKKKKLQVVVPHPERRSIINVRRSVYPGITVITFLIKNK